MTKILITGASGQLGTCLANALAKKYGRANIIATDIRPNDVLGNPFEILSVTDQAMLEEIIKKYEIKEIYHLAAILSARGESDPISSWNINMGGLLNILEMARIHNVEKVFFPSTIAVFGLDAPRINTPNGAALHPSTIYGIAKSAGENWCEYYHNRYGLDVRSLRYPGIIGWQSLPGGGTTDYAVEIFHELRKNNRYSCFLSEDAALPMMYMDDAIRATLELMEAPKENIKIRYSYNLSAISFTPAEIALEIKKHHPDFQIEYVPDFRDNIAKTWPASIDDSAARNDWGWKEEFDLPKLVEDMLHNLYINAHHLR